MPIRVQPLTERHKSDRKKFCEELLEKPENFVQRIIFGRSQVNGIVFEKL